MSEPSLTYTSKSPKGAGKPLATVLAAYILWVLAGGMALYACVQYILWPDMPVLQLVGEHLAHVVFLMVLVFAVLNFVLYRRVVVPIRQFREKLYLVSGGELSLLEADSGIREIHDLKDGINLMIERFHYDTHKTLPGNLKSHPPELRRMAKSNPDLNRADRETLLDAAAEIESLVSAVTKHSIAENQRKHRDIS